METISAAGTVLLPFFVFNSTQHSAGWYTDPIEDEASFVIQANAIMDVELGIAYTAEDVVRHTVAAAAAAGRGYHMLVVNGHKSHLSWQVVQYCLYYHI